VVWIWVIKKTIFSQARLYNPNFVSLMVINILAMDNGWPKAQLGILLIVGIYFAINSVALAAIYGSMVSLLNTGLINRHTNKQTRQLNISAGASVGMMAVSVIMRMALLVALTLFGLLILKLAAEALIIGLVLGQVGFLIDRVINK
jgi:ATP synthase protein I